ncbi:hypothetical protein D3C75_1188510 [compost metagenome]
MERLLLLCSASSAESRVKLPPLTVMSPPALRPFALVDSVSVVAVVSVDAAALLSVAAAVVVAAVSAAGISGGAA